jgi:tetratricopeptide (TPR) repeat protein
LDDLHFVDAHDKFAQAVEQDSDFAMAHLMTAITSQSVEEFFDSVSRANAAVAGVSEGEQLYIRALVARSENDQAAQRDALEKAVAAYPGDPRTHMFLGNFLNGQQDFAGATEHYTHATQLNPQFAGAYNALGYAYRSLDDLDKAKAAFEKYVELLPDEANPQDSYAELLMEMGNYAESIEHYQMAIDLDPNFSSAYAGISRNYSLMGEPERAQETADQMLAAARVFAERQNALFQSVTSYLFAGDIDAAMEVCNTMAAEAEVQRDHGAAAGAYEYMGDAMLNSDEAANAEEHFAAALEHRQQAATNDANKAQAQRNYTFKTAIAAMIAEDGEAAAARTAEYTAAAEANGTAFERRRIHALAGYLAMTNDDMAAGAEHLAQAGQFNPVVLYWSAVAQNAIGNKDKARDLAYRAANRNTLSPSLPFVRARAIKLLEELNAG